MDWLWRFVGRKRNREILGWVGGGVAVVASGIWAVTVYLSPPLKLQEVRRTEIEARCGGVAVGGSVSGSTITGGATSGADCSTRPK
jgi:hypothetical protein